MSQSDRQVKQFEFGSSHPATVTGTVRKRRWWLVALIVIVAAVVAAYVYVYQRPAVDRVLRELPVDLPGQTTEVYKWRDGAGNWQISDQKPPDGIPYETLQYDGRINVMPVAPAE
ncbi:MAG: DUF4124 domain-containing protein [Gammaproteobacteria bacterium]|nr:DUF4124 domain-containing protein [Gammaproteobacteria bacterium]